MDRNNCFFSDQREKLLQILHSIPELIITEQRQGEVEQNASSINHREKKPGNFKYKHFVYFQREFQITKLCRYITYLYWNEFRDITTFCKTQRRRMSTAVSGNKM
jgi:hypothetical protein